MPCHNHYYSALCRALSPWPPCAACSSYIFKHVLAYANARTFTPFGRVVILGRTLMLHAQPTKHINKLTTLFLWYKPGKFSLQSSLYSTKCLELYNLLPFLFQTPAHYPSLSLQNILLLINFHPNLLTALADNSGS